MDLKIIIPAAGYGKRMGSVPAKELLPHPHSGKPFLLEALYRHQTLQAPFHIISRKDKFELNNFIHSLQKNSALLQDSMASKDPFECSISLQCIEPSKEWPDTILQSKPFWAEWNLLVLPDAAYKPLVTKSQLEEFIKSASSDSTLFFTFPVEDSRSWGMVRSSSNFFEVAEKPRECSHSNNPCRAWGLILFHQKMGESLFTALLESTSDHLWKRLKGKAYEIPLEDFQDLTRVIEPT